MHPKPYILLIPLILLSSMLILPSKSAVTKTQTFPALNGISGFVASRRSSYAEAHDTLVGDEGFSMGSGGIPILGQNTWMGKWIVSRHFLRFDTRAFSGSILSAFLSFPDVSGFMNESGNFYVRTQKWTDGNDGYGLDDFSKFDGVNYDDGLCKSDKWRWNLDPVNITLVNFNIIQKGGYTDVFLRVSFDIDNHQTNNGNYVMYFFPNEGRSPLLYVTSQTVAISDPVDPIHFGFWFIIMILLWLLRRFP